MKKLFILLLMPVALVAQDKELIIREGHREMINQVLYSPDGKWIYTAGEDHVIKVWDVNSGIDIRTLAGHDAPVKSITLSSDGVTLISGDVEGKLCIWNPQTSNLPLKSIEAHEDAINVIKFAPDESRFYTGSSDKLIKAWDSGSYASLQTITGMTGIVRSFGISPNGKRMVMGAQRANDVELLLIDLETGAILDDALKHIKGAGAAKAYTAVVLAPLALVTSIGKGDIDKDMMNFYVFDYSNIEFKKNGREVLISQNLYLPMTAAKDEEDKTGGTSVSIAELNESQTAFQNVNSMKRWQIDYPKSRAIFNEDQSKIIVNIKHSIRIYDIANAEFPTNYKEANAYEPPVLKEFEGDINWLTSLAISPDYRTIVSSSEDRNLDLWDVQSGRKIRRMKGYVQPALAVEMMPDGEHILVGSRHKNMTMWNVATGRLVRTFARSADVNHIDVSEDGKYLVTSSVDTRFFKLWSVRTGNILATYMEKKDNVHWVQFDEDPEYILAETEDGVLKRWSKDDKKIKKTLKEPRSDYDDRTTTYEVTLADRILTIEGGNVHLSDEQQGEITDLLIDDRSNRAFTTNAMGEISMYNLASGEKTVSFALIDDFDFITYTPDFFYTSSKGAASALAFRSNQAIVPFEQMEVIYNRPDVIAERLGADQKLVDSYRVAYKKRLKRLGLDGASGASGLPKVHIDVSNYPLATTDATFTYEVAAEGNIPIDRIRVFVNDVPANGIRGKDVSNQNAHRITETLTVELSAGVNEIKTVAVNKEGVESIPEVMEITYEAPYRNPDLYLLSVGVSTYADSRYNLSFAAKDAEEVATFLSGSSIFGKVHSRIITNEEATDQGILEAGQFLAEAKIDDMVVVFIAGHGVLDQSYNYYFGTYNMDFSNPANGGLLYDELSDLLTWCKSRNKLFFMDTCHSGEIDADEVATVRQSVKRSGKVAFRSGGDIVQYKEDAFGLENTLELSKTLFGDLKKGTGTTVISAAGGTEFALEGLDSQNGLFTSSLMEGINTRRADLNRDRVYTVSEIRKYITDRVVNLSDGAQVPTSREENLKNDFRLF